MLNRTIPPPIQHAIDFDIQLPACQQFTLSNGIQIYAVSAGEEDVLQVEWIFGAGNCFENNNLVAGATNQLIKNGTNTRSSFEISDQIDFYGAFLGAQCFHQTASVTLHTLSRHLPALLPIMVDLFTEASFPQQELDIFVQNSKQRLQVNLKKCDFVAGREIDVLLFGENHPYARYNRAADLDALETSQLKAFYRSFYSEGEVAIFVAGKLPPNFVDELETNFGQLPWQRLQPTALPSIALSSPPALRTVRINNDENGVQGAIRIASHFPNRHHPDFMKTQVLNNVFGGFFGSRLMSNIREDKGYTYGIHSYLHKYIDCSSWMISTEAGREVCEATIKEVYHEMANLCKEPIGNEEILLVRNFMLGSILGSLDGPFQIISRWKSYFLYGIADGQSDFNQSLQTIRTVTTEELQALAKQYLQPEFFYELVVV